MIEDARRVLERASKQATKRHIDMLNQKMMQGNPNYNHPTACWGWRIGKNLHKYRGKDVLVFERGYIGDRFIWTSIAWNGLNGRGDFCLREQVTMDRFNQYFSMKPWKDDGHNIIIMGQVAGDASLEGKNLTSFYEKIARDLKLYYNKPVYFRPHPLANRRGNAFKPRIPIIGGTLHEAFDDAFFVATYNSNSAVDSVLAGIPTLSFDKGCMAYGVTGHNEKTRILPDREQWAARLAWCQWTPQEIENLEYWPRMRSKLKHPIKNNPAAQNKPLNIHIPPGFEMITR